MSKPQTNYGNSWQKRSGAEIVATVRQLKKMHAGGELGGQIMPEDANPGLPKQCRDNYHYFTLPMALNYQRNSYSLWKAAQQTYLNPDTKTVFDPELVLKMSVADLKDILSRHKIALQPCKQTETWQRLCYSICELFNGDIRKLFQDTAAHVPTILNYIQKSHKKKFPYLSGPKICNYWLYVLSQYTDLALQTKEALTVAPDTHVIQASVRLGLVSPQQCARPDIQAVIGREWMEVLKGTELISIDIHTSLWLWSRTGFIPIHD